MPAPLRLYIAAVLAWLVLYAPAQACSVRSGYRPPSSIALTAQADAIVLVKVSDGGRSEEAGFHKVRLAYLQSLKGPPPHGPIAFDDAYLAPADISIARSDPSDLSKPNSDVFNGGCNRYLFKEGMILLAFLKNYGGRSTIYAPPFTRALEDVPNADALWVLDLVAASPPDGLGDGEAAAIAIAVHRGAAIAVDENKARRILSERFPNVKVLRSAELLTHPAVLSELGQEIASECFAKARRYGRMHVS